ncbi:signal transduction histidine kinase [Flavobacterium gossypii]|uniref:histidine kinase n=2 Tax=Flavobacterium TaxID=237 RepID=A0A495M3J3_9FLAO|nr:MULTISPECIES: GAF domain-containing sensor histidine kinase [Flavobacterium]MBA9074925.1 signal transduction histidine kinase [Flavobacterium gossypii]RKS20491.1 signal transduction histidine kinase [Flavobacterium endophyticum]WDO12198.1 GAF domain-containing sensor histidine kinase [Flavobacterium sp. WW92]
MIYKKPISIIPSNEALRLQKLYDYQVLDTHSEDTFDKIALLASQIFNTKNAFVTFVDEHRVYFKANIGDFQASEVSREDSLCSLAILDEKMTVFNDTHSVPDLLKNPFVTATNGIRFYAGAPLKSPEGYSMGTVCVIDSVPKEVTEHQMAMLRTLSDIVMNKLESRLRYNTIIKSQNDLMGIALHEIKNPLASISLANDILRMDTSKTPKMTDMIKRCVATIQNKLADLLKLSEDEEKEQRLSIEEADLKEMLDRLINNFELLANKKNQIIELTIEDSLPKINIDKTKISDVLHNLLSNAIKYSYSNSTIKIIAKKIDDFVEIEFKDQGQGLNDEDADKLFKKFAKLSSKPTGKESSNGLGLSICKSFVELHKGQIFAKSPGKELGTSFFISLPIIFKQEEETESAYQ